MPTVLNPYLHFNGEAEAAMNFYKDIFGGEVEISRYGDFSGVPLEESQKNQVMHSVIKTDALQLMASDGGPMGTVKPGENISLSLSGDDQTTLTKYFEALGEGGTITVPLAKQVWGDTFGMVTDKFGIRWMVNITAPQN